MGRRGTSTSIFVSRGRCGTWRHPLLRGRRGTYGIDFAWQAWRMAASIFVSRGMCGTWRHPSAFCVAGVALGHLHFSTWRHPPSFRVAGVALVATSNFVSRGRCGTWSHSPSFCEAGVALITLGWLWWCAWARWGALGCVTPPNFAWQACHLATSTFVSRGRGGTYGTGLALQVGALRMTQPNIAWQACTWRHPSSFRVAVALVYIHLRSVWQVWHLVTSTLALGDIHLRFAWQVWHLATSAFVWHGRCGTWSHSPSFCVAGVALMALGWLWWRAWAGALGRARLVAGDAAQLCIAGVSLGDIHFRFAWQVCGTWSNSLSFRVAGVAFMWHWALFCVAGVLGWLWWRAWARWGTLGRQWRRPTLRGRRGTWRCPSSFRAACVALGDIHLRSAWQAWHLVTSILALDDIHLRFAWQVWHLATSTFVSCGRCGTWSHSPSFCEAGVALMALGWLWWRRAWARFVWQACHLATSTFVSRGRCGTWRHPPSFRVAGVALGRIHRRFARQVWHLWHWAGSDGGALGRALCGRRVTWRHPPSFRVAGVYMALGFVLRGKRDTYGTELALVARLGALGHAWSPMTRGCGTCLHIHLRSAWQAWYLFTSILALGDIHLRFAWQVWNLVTFTFVLRGRCGIHGTGLALVARLGALGRDCSPVTPPNFAWQGWQARHRSSFRVAGVAIADFNKNVCSDAACQCLPWTQFMFCAGLHFLIQQFFVLCSHICISDMLWCLYTASWDPAPCSFATHDLSHTNLSHATFSSSHTIFHIPHFVTHNSSHTTCFTSRSSTTSFVFPSSPSLLQHLLLINYWKKLTCGVIRSSNFWWLPSGYLTQTWTITFFDGKSLYIILK